MMKTYSYTTQQTHRHKTTDTQTQHEGLRSALIKISKGAAGNMCCSVLQCVAAGNIHTHTHIHTHVHTHTHTPRGTEQCFDEGSQELLPNTRTHTYTNTYTHTHKRVCAHTRTHLEGLSSASRSSLDFAESFSGSNLARFDPPKETCKEFRNTGESPQRWTKIKVSQRWTKVKVCAQGDLATGL